MFAEFFLASLLGRFKHIVIIMGFQAQPSCFLAILRYFRSLQSQERCYNLSHGKGKKEEEDLQLIIARNPCFEQNTPSIFTFKDIVSNITKLSKKLLLAAEEYSSKSPHRQIDPENSTLIHYLLTVKDYQFSSKKEYWSLLGIKQPGLEAEKALNPSFDEEEMAKEITSELLSLAISDNDNKNVREQKGGKRISVKEQQVQKEKDIPKRKYKERPIVMKKEGAENIDVDEEDEEETEGKGQGKKKRMKADNSNVLNPINAIAQVLITKETRRAEKEDKDNIKQRFNDLFSTITREDKYESNDSFLVAKDILQKLGVDDGNSMQGMELEELKQISEHMKKAAGRAVVMEMQDLIKTKNSFKP